MSLVDRSLIKNDKEYYSKCEEYMNYINNHKSNVYKAFNELFVSKQIIIDGYSQDEMDDIIRICDAKIRRHDDSKFSDEEFYDYRIYYYPTTIEKNEMLNNEEAQIVTDERYNDACKHHASINSHHPWFYAINKITAKNKYTIIDYTKYDIERDTSDQDMTICDIIEMICDFASFDIDQKFNYIPYYLSDKADDVRQYMTDNSKLLFEKITKQILPDEYTLSDSPIWKLKN